MMEERERGMRMNKKNWRRKWKKNRMKVKAALYHKASHLK
jgi:hypothetical protein